MCLGRINRKKKKEISVYLPTISKWKNFRSERLDLKRSSLFEGGSLENLESRISLRRRCRCMHLEESASDGGGWCAAIEGRYGERGLRKKRWEGLRPSLARRRRSDVSAGGTKTEGIRAPGVCTLFRVSARERGIWRRWRQLEYLKGVKLQKNTCYGARTPLK